MSNLPHHQATASRPVHQKRKRAKATSSVPRDYLARADLLALVPLSMSTIDNLEKADIFPSRFRLEPTTRVAWKRREVEKFLEQRAAKRVHGRWKHPA